MPEPIDPRPITATFCFSGIAMLSLPSGFQKSQR